MVIKEFLDQHNVMGRHLSDATCLAISSTGNKIYSGSDDNLICCWDVNTKKKDFDILGISKKDEKDNELSFIKPVFKIDGHQKNVYGLQLSKDDKTLYSCSEDNTIAKWDVSGDKGQKINMVTAHEEDVLAIVLSNDGSTLFSASSDTTIKAWDANTLSEKYTLRGHVSGVTCLKISNDNTKLYSGSWDTTAKVWDLNSQKDIMTFSGHKDIIECILLSHDEKTLFTGSRDEYIKAWSLEKSDEEEDRDEDQEDKKGGQELYSLEGHSNAVTCLLMSPDGKFLYSGSRDLTIKIWILKTQKEGQTIRGHKDKVNDIIMSPNKQFLFSASDDNTIKIWNAITKEEHPVFKGHEKPVRWIQTC